MNRSKRYSLAILAALVGCLAISGTASAATTRDATRWPFTSSSPWNYPVGSGAVFESATGGCTRDISDKSLITDINAAQYSHPVYVATSTDPLTKITVGGKVKATIRVPANAQPARPTFSEDPWTDAHMHVIQPAANGDQVVYEMWRAKRTSSGITADSLSKNSLYSSGVGAGGERAYGGSALGGLIRTFELQGRAIPHALALAIPRNHLRLGQVWPAIWQDAGAVGTYLGNVPMGTFAAIPPSVNIDQLGLTSTTVKTMARALQNYGAYIVDATSSDASFTAEPSADSLLGNFWSDLTKLRGQLRCVTNNTPSTIGGGGTPRVALAPPLAAAPAAKLHANTIHRRHHHRKHRHH